MVVNGRVRRIGGVGLPVLLLFLCPALTAQVEDSQPLKAFLKETLGGTPRMAWLVPPNKVITTGKIDRIYILGTFPQVEEARYSGPLEPAAIQQLQEEHTMLCPPVDGIQFHSYELTKVEVSESSRVFYTTSSVASKISAGMQVQDIPLEAMASLKQEFFPNDETYLHRGFAVRVSGADSYFTFHGLYGKSSEEMFKQAIFLHSADGRILGRAAWPVEYESLCDGCGIPDINFPLERWFSVLNGFRFPGLEFPVLLRNTGTIEGRAISLVSFGDEGNYNEIRDYEYVVTCILGMPGAH